MGVVYKARQRQLNRLVAVKILPPSVGEDPAFAERFAREAQALAQLNHPNIVQVYDFGRTDEFFYFVMEYVDGVNLRALIRDGKLKPEEALKIVPQICEALQFAHDEGIVHRDIKPENILIDKKGRVKIADFGLAKLLGRAAEDLSLTGTGQLMGTLGYMAPEQLQQAHSVDHRADIYSLGVVFYEMLTGQLPIGRFEPPSKKVQVDVRLDEVVLRSLESEPDRRYQHASDVKTDLEIISAQSSPKEPPASKPAHGSQSDRSAHPPWVVTTFAKWWSERDRWVASGVKTGLLIRTEAFAWTCAIAAICFGSIGFFLPIVMLRSYTPVSSILLTFFISETGALVFGILGRRVMKFAVPIALIVVGGLLILTPVVGHVYENTNIRQMLVDVQKQTVTPGFTNAARTRQPKRGFEPRSNWPKRTHTTTFVSVLEP